MSILDVNFEALGESPHGSSASSASSALQVDNVGHLTLADFENYCNPTGTNSKDKTELVNKNSDKTTDLLNSQGLSEKLEGEIEVNQQMWLDNSQNENNDGLDNTLTLSPSLYSSNEQQPIPIAISSEGQHYITIKDSNSCATESPSKVSWTNMQAEDPEVMAKSSEYIITRSDHFPNFQGTVNTSVLEKARPIPSTWPDASDHEVTTYLAETVPAQVYSQAQPSQFRVELANDGQQYMIMDGKYFSENAQDLTPFHVGGNNQYYFMAEYPTVSHSSATQSTSTDSTSTCFNPLNAFQNYTEHENQVIDKEVLEEQKRKEQMQIRRREKNKDCSRAFRRNQKEKERKLREGRIEKQGRLKELNRKNENFIRMLSKAALQGCDKAKDIAATNMESWNKENKTGSFRTGNV